jgi:hypothetical protein
MVLSFVATNIQLGLLRHAGVVMNRFEIVSGVEYLRSRHESGLLSRQVGGKVLMKLRGVEISETVCRLLYRCRFAQIT